MARVLEYTPALSRMCGSHTSRFYKENGGEYARTLFYEIPSFRILVTHIRKKKITTLIGTLFNEI